MADLGFIGLGIMGKPMATHLVKAGNRVYVYDKVASSMKALEAEGAIPCAGKIRKLFIIRREILRNEWEGMAELEILHLLMIVRPLNDKKRGHKQCQTKKNQNEMLCFLIHSPYNFPSALVGT